MTTMLVYDRMERGTRRECESVTKGAFTATMTGYKAHPDRENDRVYVYDPEVYELEFKGWTSEVGLDEDTLTSMGDDYEMAFIMQGYIVLPGIRMKWVDDQFHWELPVLKEL